MIMQAMGLHPSEETLSRLADQSEIERMRSSAGRHATNCARCSATLGAFAALGEAARSVPEPALPTTLFARIDAGRNAAPETPSPRAPVSPLSSLETAGGQPRHWMTRRRGAVIAAAATIVVIALVAPMWRSQTVAAAGPGAATIYPRYPKPGATIGIRFVPAPGWVGRDTLWVEGIVDLRFDPDHRRRVSIATLSTVIVRGNDGAYLGRATLPADALSGRLRITTAPVTVPDGRWVANIVLLTAASSGDRPSLEAMESAAYEDRSFMVAGVLADAFARWAPGHPMRWLVTTAGSHARGFDWVEYFTGGERRFARLTTRLNATASARPGELAGMAGLAYRLEEPEAAALWTERLVREHPENPWALELRVRQLHEMELRGAPRDSIARLLPSLDTLYERSGGELRRPYEIRSLVANNGDSATIHRWAVREARAGRYYFNEFFGRRTTFLDAELRDSVEAYAREVLAMPPTGEAPTSERSSLYQIERARAYSYLASVALARKQYRAAVVLADSGRLDECHWPGQDTRAIALIALGDTAQAVPYLAAFGKNSTVLSADSAQRMLGSYFNAQRWQQAVDSVESLRQQCRRAPR
jgi:hypothetical protein